MSTLIAVVAASLSVSFLCSILEAVFLSITYAYVGALRDAGHRAGELLHSMQKQIDQPIAAILTTNTIANTLGSTLAGTLARGVFDSVGVGIFVGGLTFGVLFFSEIIPKTLGATYWQELAVPSAYVLRALIFVMKPIIVPLNLISGLIPKREGQPTVSRAELEVLASIGRREGTLDEDEWKVVSNVIRLDEIAVAEVLTPRTDMVAISVDATLDEAMQLMLDEGHLRVPVFEGNLDSIVGILLARDLWRTERNGGGHLRDIMRQPSFAPASKPIEDLIPEMREQRNKMVIVLDEFGGTAGLVTLEDLIEEIIGEIQDEHEHDEPRNFTKLESGRWRIWGGVPLREVAERLDLDLPVEQYDTLGGYLFGRLSRIGRVGDEVTESEGNFQITRMRGRRIEFASWQPTERQHRPGATG